LSERLKILAPFPQSPQPLGDHVTESDDTSIDQSINQWINHTNKM